MVSTTVTADNLPGHLAILVTTWVDGGAPTAGRPRAGRTGRSTWASSAGRPTSSVELASPARTTAACSGAVRSCSSLTTGDAGPVDDDAGPVDDVDRTHGLQPRRRRGAGRRGPPGRLPRPV